MIQTTATESSVEPPCSLPEDMIVGEILVRLPVKALFKLKCVSKRYNWIISSDTNLGGRFMRRASSSRKSWSSSGLSSPMLLPSALNLPPAFAFDDKPLQLRPFSSPEDGRDGHIMVGSSNGLVLSRFPSLPRLMFSLCVSNPLTKQWAHLPDSIMLSNLRAFELDYGIATSRSRAPRGAFLAYKVVVIQHKSPPEGLKLPSSWGDEYVTTTIQVFSSDTGSWSKARKVSCPGVIMDTHGAWLAGFAYNGIFHWLDRTAGNVITYDPFDSPDGFERIELPLDALGSSSQYSSLINSGEEMLRYCEFTNLADPHRQKLSVWRLVDSSSGWSREQNCSPEVLSLPYPHPPIGLKLMVAPIPWNRKLLCHPFLIGFCFIVLDSRLERRRSTMVALVPGLEATRRRHLRWLPFENPLIPLQMCPWSSPFYTLIIDQ